MCANEIEAAEKLARGGVGFSSDNVEVNTTAPENGNVKFTVAPKIGEREMWNGLLVAGGYNMV